MPSERPRRTRGVLEGHRRIGKKFVPSLALLGNLAEVSWLEEILPELLWLDLLKQCHGIRRGVALAVRLADAVPAQANGHCRILAKTDEYSTLSSNDWASLHSTIGLHDLDDLRRALLPLVALFPECPFRLLWGELNTDDVLVPKHLVIVRDAVAAVTDRRSIRAMLIQGTAVHLSIVTGQTQFASGVEAPNLEALLDYPETEESKLVAGRVRAQVNGGLWPPGMEHPSGWARYFWKRGLDLGPCEFAAGDNLES